MVSSVVTLVSTKKTKIIIILNFYLKRELNVQNFIWSTKARTVLVPGFVPLANRRIKKSSWIDDGSSELTVHQYIFVYTQLKVHGRYKK